MIKKIVISILYSFLTCYLVAQPTIQWQKSLGGSNIETALSIDTTNNGGYIVAGQSMSSDGDVTINKGGYDYWVVKLDNTGAIEWEKSYGGSGDERPYVIHQTTDMGYIIAGQSASSDGDITSNKGQNDYWILKLDSFGNIDWEKSLGGSGSDIAWDIKQTNDLGYIVTGYTNSNDGDVTNNKGQNDYWVVKLDGLGILQWEKTLGGSQSDKAYSIEETIDLGYIVAGESFSIDGDVTGNNGGRDYWIVKLDMNGNLQWEKNYGGSSDDAAFKVMQTQNNMYLIAGNSGSTDGDVTGHHGGIAVDDYWVLKLDSLGNLIWEKSIGGTFVDVATDLKQDIDGNYIIFGTSASTDGDVTSNYGNWDYWLVNLDSMGNIIWEKNYGGSFSEYSYGIQLDNNGGYVLSGQTTSNDVDVSGNHGSGDFWVVKLNPLVNINELEYGNDDIFVYPNPNNGVFNIDTKLAIEKIEIYNLLGDKIKEQLITKNNVVINMQAYNKGTYFIKVTTSNQVIIKKIIYQ